MKSPVPGFPSMNVLWGAFKTIPQLGVEELKLFDLVFHRLYTQTSEEPGRIQSFH